MQFDRIWWGWGTKKFLTKTGEAKDNFLQIDGYSSEERGEAVRTPGLQTQGYQGAEERSEEEKKQFLVTGPPYLP